MAKHLLAFFFTSSLLMIGHSAMAQQLPDPLLTKHDPMMFLPEVNTETAQTIIPGDTIPPCIWWPTVSLTNSGITWFTTTYTISGMACDGWTVSVDTTLRIPYADSFLGVKANAVASVKITNAAKASSFGNSACRFTTKVPEQ